ncbi:MAG: N-acetyltransferase family protein [Geopsychrobacter sp.]|nr:N-acetyltransferase family protein [Geopsychrobacter sp.]
MLTTITPRPAQARDLPRLTEIYNQIIAEGGFTADLEPYTVNERHPWLEEHQQSPFLIYVLEDSLCILGYFYFSAWRSGRPAMSEVAEVSYYLAAEARGKGLGRLMLAEAQQIAIKSGLKYLLAILLESNLGSRMLLEHGGFERVGHLPEIANLGTKRCGQLIMYKKLEGEKR